MAKPASTGPSAHDAPVPNAVRSDPRIPADPGEEMPRRTRRSTLNKTGMATDIPERFKKPGWAYGWFPFSVLNEQVEPWMQSAVEDGGWEPVRTEEMPGYMPSGFTGSVIEYGGQRLYSRPQYLEDESRMEDEMRARRQSDGRLSAARVDDPRAPHTYGIQAPDETFVKRGQQGGDPRAMEEQMMRERESSRRARENQDPLGGGLKTSADDISQEERQEIAENFRRGRGRFAG
jgi:hypothetical protein